MASDQEPSIRIRPASSADLNRILEIERSAPSAAHWPLSDYHLALSATSPRRILLVAEIAARIEGLLVARSPLTTEWEIENVVVAETARRRGLGAALVSTFVEQIALDKPPNNDLVVYLEVRESNVAARQLYEKLGFHLDNRRRAYYRSPDEDAVVYRYSYQ